MSEEKIPLTHMRHTPEMRLNAAPLLHRDGSLEHEYLVKDFRVWMDSDLSVDDHIYDKINVANKMLGTIRRNLVDLEKTIFSYFTKG